MDLVVSLTEEQYARYRAAFKQLHSMEDEPTDEQLIAQLKREAAAVTHAAEVGAGSVDNWNF